MISSSYNDVTALVLSVGEATTDEALASLTLQTLQPRDTIIVRDIVPFHKALNIGVEQVKAPFFVQVDADMILDRNCLATLRRNICSDVGIVVGYLRDGLSGQVVGVKLFRTACFDNLRFRDAISPDTDFVKDIAQAGWKTIYVGWPKRLKTGRWPTLGEHRPDYTAAYTYAKFLLEGCRYCYRDALGGFRGHSLCLTTSSHPSALIAQIGLARGLFLEPHRDLLGRPHHEGETRSLLSFLSGTQDEVSVETGFELPSDKPLDERFQYFYRLGFGLFRDKRIATFRSLMSSLDESTDSDAWISKIALCKGLLEPDVEEGRIARDYAILRRFVPQLPMQAPRIDTSFAAIAVYSAEIGLKSFVIAGPKPAEYRIARTADEPKYQQTERAVRTSLQSGRPRIAAPRLLFGNVICTEPEHIRSLYWCVDLLRAGYLSVHIPTAMGPRRMSLFGQLMANIAQRFPLQRKMIAPSRAGGSERCAALDRLARPRRPNYGPEPGCVLLVAGDLGCGGSERQMLALSSGLVKRGYQVRLVVLRRTRPGRPSFEPEFLRVGIVPQYAWEFDVGAEAGFRPLAAARLGADLSKLRRPFSVVVPQLIRAIRNYRPQIVHGWLNSPGLAAALAATSLGTPRVVVQFGSMSLQHTGQYPHLHDYFLRGFRAIARNPTVSLLANSTAGASDYARWLDLPPGHVHVIKNGLMSETVRMPSKGELSAYRSRLKIPADVPVVGTVMRFAEVKDPWLWLDAAAEIAKVSPRAWFVLAGYGELLEGCKERAQALGLHRIVFPGPVKDVGLIYALLDVFLLTSRVEGLPNVLIEAQAAGCPVVTTAVGGTDEALIDGVTGRVVNERSPESIALAVLDVLSDATWRERVHREARDLIADRFDFEKMVDATLVAYREPLWRAADDRQAADFAHAPAEAIKPPNQP